MVVVIPRATAEEAVTRTEQVTETEDLARSAILGGTDPVEAYLKHGKFFPSRARSAVLPAP